MNTQRQARPKRSGHSSDSHGGHARGKNYPYKSYLDANTQEQARFDSMQGELPSKIEEVMASFREEKLTVHPQRPHVVDEITTANTPFFSTAKPVRHQKKSQKIWPWLVGASVLAAIIGFGLAKRTAPETPPAAVVVAPAESPAPVVATPAVPAVQQAKPTAPEKKIVAPPAPTSPATPPKKKAKKTAKVKTYSEDMSF